MLELLKNLWAMVGISLLLLAGALVFLETFAPGWDGSRQVVPGTATPDRIDADVYADPERARAIHRDHRAAQRLRWESYTYWRREPIDGAFIGVDANGRRVSWNPDDAPDAPRVFFFGGSTMWGTGVVDDATIPSLVSKHLHAAGEPVHVVNFGETGWVSTQGAIALLRELQAGNAPDAVVFYDGVNDVFSAVQDGSAGTPMNEQRRRTEFNAILYDRQLLGVLWARLEGVRRFATWLRGQPPPAVPEGLAAPIVEAYVANVRAVTALARDWGFAARFYWQPVVFSKQQLSPHEQQAVDASLRDHRDLHLASHRAVRTNPDLARIETFRDLSALLDAEREPLFLDFCHLADEGNARVAQEIASDLISAR